MTKTEDQFAALGLIAAKEGDFSPLTNEEVARLEALAGGRFPDDYRAFLTSFGACEFDEYAVFPTKGGGVAPGLFFGRELEAALGEGADRLPHGVIPINDDGGGNWICMSLRNEDFGAVYFQSHSVGGDEDDDDEDEARATTLAFLASSFSEFVEGLVPE